MIDYRTTIEATARKKAGLSFTISNVGFPSFE